MNQLEHLKALRDKARVQTEQAKAVLKQQGEISESLDRLIADLEGKESGDGDTRNDSIPAAGGAVAGVVASGLTGGGAEETATGGEEGSPGQMIANLDENKADSEAAHDDVVWVEQAAPVIPPVVKEPVEKEVPKLEPIVWEVAEETTLPSSEEATGERDESVTGSDEPSGDETSSDEPSDAGGSGISGALAAAGGVAAAAAGVAVVSGLDKGGNEGDGEGSKFKFLKFGKQEEGTATEVEERVESESTSESVESESDSEAASDVSEDTVAINPMQAVPAPTPIPVIVNETESGAEDTPETDAAEAKEEAGGESGEEAEGESKEEAGGESKEEAEGESKEEAGEVSKEETGGESKEEAGGDLKEETGEESKEESKMVPPPVPLPKPPAPVPPLAPVPPAAEGNDAPAISPPPLPLPAKAAAAAAAVGAVGAVGATAAKLMGDKKEDATVADSPVIPVAKPEDEPALAVVSSNIFFDANSAYLKDSELTKIQTVSAAIAGGDPRLVKIQGLEDLASSNDFKVLLASRRLLAVKKKLGEQGIGPDQMTINEIDLSDEGRVLNPPSISVASR